MEIGTMIAIGSLIASAISGVVQAVSNYSSTTKTNAANLAQSQALNEEAWRRDDTSFQRAVADARAAGLSPLAAVDNAGFNTAPIMSTANAPQLDLSGLMGALGSTANFMGERNQQKETERHNKAQETQAKKELMFNMRKIWNDNSQAAKAIRAEDKRVLFKSHNESESKRESDSQATLREINKATGLNIPAETCRDWETYVKKLSEANAAWAEINENYTATQSWKNSSSKSESSTKSGGAFSVSGSGSDAKSESWTANDKYRWEVAIQGWEYEEQIAFRDGKPWVDGHKKRTFTWPIYIGNQKTEF